VHNPERIGEVRERRFFLLVESEGDVFTGEEGFGAYDVIIGSEANGYAEITLATHHCVCSCGL